jgi:uncharacterized protein (DUF486 family)
MSPAFAGLFIFDFLIGFCANYYFTACFQCLHDLCVVLSFKAGRMAIMEGHCIELADCFFEYSIMVPANRYGFAKGFSGFQLKMIQEIITLAVFTFFAVLYLKEPLHWRYLVSFAFLLDAVYFMFSKRFG